MNSHISTHTIPSQDIHRLSESVIPLQESVERGKQITVRHLSFKKTLQMEKIFALETKDALDGEKGACLFVIQFPQ